MFGFRSWVSHILQPDKNKRPLNRKTAWKTCFFLSVACSSTGLFLWLLARPKWAVTTLWGLSWNLCLSPNWPTNKALKPDTSVEDEREKHTHTYTKVKAQHFLQLREADDLVLSVWLPAWEQQWTMAGCAWETESWGVESMGMFCLFVFLDGDWSKDATITVVFPEETKDRKGGWGGDEDVFTKPSRTIY